jgi:hypothetical protein
VGSEADEPSAKARVRPAGPPCRVGWAERAARLSFNLYDPPGAGGGDAELERRWASAAGRQSAPTDRLVAAGTGAVHVLLAAAVLATGARAQAAVALAVAAQQFTIAALVARRPAAFLRWRGATYTFNILWAVAAATLHGSALHLSFCRPGGGPLFWATEFTAASLPWFYLHALVFPLPAHRAAAVHGAGAVALAATAPLRCARSLAACPAGGPAFQAAAAAAARALAVFAPATRHAAPPTPAAACVAAYVAATALVYVAALHAVWLAEHASRLAFLARTERVDVEWELERLRPGGAPRALLAAELAAAGALLTAPAAAAAPLLLAVWGGRCGA